MDFIDLKGIDNIDYSYIRNIVKDVEDKKNVAFINANDNVYNKLEESGITGVIDVYKVPEEIDINDYELKGEGYTAESYFSKKDDSMMKLYFDFVPFEKCIIEKQTAKRCVSMGIPTPFPGKLVKVGNRFGIEFECMRDKISYSKLIAASADDSQKLKSYAKEFASICKKLHSIECDTRHFISAKVKYKELVLNSKYVNEEQKKMLIDFIDSTSDVTTCLHCDLQIGNVIKTSIGNLFIDLGDFSYGDPLHDIAMMDFVCNKGQEEIQYQLYHITKKTRQEFWNYFVKYYFDISTDREVEEINKKLKYYTIIKTLYIISMGATEDYMLEILANQFTS